MQTGDKLAYVSCGNYLCTTAISSFLLQLLPALNIYAWTEEHVHFWMSQMNFGAGQGVCDMQMYAELFKENHITGRRLLLLTETDMKDLGVRSKGHIIHLKSEIEKLTNDYLGLFHFPPLRKDEGAEEEEDEKKVIGLELVFGYHWKPGTGPQDCKWKMYMELDGDEVAITYIKDVTFNANRPDVDAVKMTKPPFVMDKWIVGLLDNQVVDCMVNYENDVRSPKVTRHSHLIQWNPFSGRDDIITLELVIQSAQSDMEGKARSRSNSDVDPLWMFRLRQKQLKILLRSGRKKVAESQPVIALDRYRELIPQLWAVQKALVHSLGVKGQQPLQHHL
ncbi:hypothetical protein COCON_G00049490 [Conger conger]|uniref:SAM domain-containing protein n=1 Tax=Conger conger TaxID=82655 RepID=A0A9Q1DV60_CONCO|nr:hypothetical protein COCON_G00049490 [Conger conger]